MKEKERRAMSEDRLERALQEMKQEDRRCGDARGRARSRLGHDDERCRRPAVRSSGQTSARI